MVRGVFRNLQIIHNIFCKNKLYNRCSTVSQICVCNETSLIKLTALDSFKENVHVTVMVRARLLVVNTCKTVNITDNIARDIMILILIKTERYKTRF